MTTERDTYVKKVAEAKEAILDFLEIHGEPVDAMEIIRFYNPEPIIRQEFLSVAFVEMLNSKEITLDGERKVALHV